MLVDNSDKRRLKAGSSNSKLGEVLLVVQDVEELRHRRNTILAVGCDGHLKTSGDVVHPSGPRNSFHDGLHLELIEAPAAREVDLVGSVASLQLFRSTDGYMGVEQLYQKQER